MLKGRELIEQIRTLKIKSTDYSVTSLKQDIYIHKHSEIPVLELCSATFASLFLAEDTLAGCDLLPSSGKVSDLLQYKTHFVNTILHTSQSPTKQYFLARTSIDFSFSSPVYLEDKYFQNTSTSADTE